MRVLFLLLAVFGGSGIVIYIVMWIIVPDASKAADRLTVFARRG